MSPQSPLFGRRQVLTGTASAALGVALVPATEAAAGTRPRPFGRTDHRPPAEPADPLRRPPGPGRPHHRQGGRQRDAGPPSGLDPGHRARHLPRDRRRRRRPDRHDLARRLRDPRDVVDRVRQRRRHPQARRRHLRHQRVAPPPPCRPTASPPASHLRQRLAARRPPRRSPAPRPSPSRCRATARLPSTAGSSATRTPCTPTPSPWPPSPGSTTATATSRATSTSSSAGPPPSSSDCHFRTLIRDRPGGRPVRLRLRALHRRRQPARLPGHPQPDQQRGARRLLQAGPPLGARAPTHRPAHARPSARPGSAPGIDAVAPYTEHVARPTPGRTSGSPSTATPAPAR